MKTEEKSAEIVEACATCVFWRKRPSTIAAQPLGYCVRFPPTPDMSRAEGHLFPTTGPDVWCGEYESPEDRETRELMRKASRELAGAARMFADTMNPELTPPDNLNG